MGASPKPRRGIQHVACESMDRTLESVHRPNRKRYSAVTCMRGRLAAAARKEEDPMGVMYVTAGTATMALDAVTCELRWRHEWTVKARTNFPMHRGVALKDGKVIRGTLDAYLIALDAASGELLWETPAGNADAGESFTMPPLVYDDLIIIAPAGSEAGIRGWVGAFRLEDGAPVWRFNTIPEPGEPGSETWSDPASDQIGGGAVWAPLGFDPESGHVYVPVANPAPDFYGDVREGDNLYTSSIVVLDVRTGELQWYFQDAPHDVHDWDLTQATPLYSATVNGEHRRLVATVGKRGVLHALDRETHEHLWEVPVTRRENSSAPVTVDGVRACPGILGGVEWSAPAYHPPLDLLYTPAIDWCGSYFKAESFDGRRWLGGRYQGDDWDEARGLITATDASTGGVRWTYQSPRPMLASITATSGGLLITGELTGDLLILDAADGSVLHRFDTGAPNNGGNATYTVDGKQYIALMSGNTSPLWPTPPAEGQVIIFGLPD